MVDLNLDYRITAIVVGMVISKAIDEIFRHAGIVFTCNEKMECLQAKVKSLQSIITRSEKHLRESNNGQIISTKLALKDWVVKLQDLHRDSSEMEQNIPKINVISRYRTGNNIYKKISDLDKHLELVPLIQLEFTLWTLSDITVQTLAAPSELAGVCCLRKTGKISVIKQILGDIKMVLCFNEELATLTDLVTSIKPIFDEIREIQDLRFRIHTMHEAINEWLKSLSELLKEADNIMSVPWWNVICRYKKGKEITSLLSDIDGHVKLASVIQLEPLFQLTELVEDKSHQIREYSETVMRATSTEIFRDVRTREAEEVE